jgi:hypothetical protein
MHQFDIETIYQSILDWHRLHDDDDNVVPTRWKDWDDYCRNPTRRPATHSTISNDDEQMTPVIVTSKRDDGVKKRKSKRLSMNSLTSLFERKSGGGGK